MEFPKGRPNQNPLPELTQTDLCQKGSAEPTRTNASFVPYQHWQNETSKKLKIISTYHNFSSLHTILFQLMRAKLYYGLRQQLRYSLADTCPDRSESIIALWIQRTVVVATDCNEAHASISSFNSIQF